MFGNFGKIVVEEKDSLTCQSSIVTSIIMPGEQTSTWNWRISDEADNPSSVVKSVTK